DPAFIANVGHSIRELATIELRHLIGRVGGLKDGRCGFHATELDDGRALGRFRAGIDIDTEILDGLFGVLRALDLAERRFDAGAVLGRDDARVMGDSPAYDANNRADENDDAEDQAEGDENHFQTTATFWYGRTLVGRLGDSTAGLSGGRSGFGAAAGTEGGGVGHIGAARCAESHGGSLWAVV